VDPLTLAIGAGLAYAASGGARKDNAERRFKAASELYENNQAQLVSAEQLRGSVVKKLSDLAARGVKNVAMAQKMLSPLEATWFKNPLEIDSQQRQRMTLALHRSRELSSGFYAATSLATGVATAGALWFGTQAIGIASTGMPILFLHGAALHNASLAFLGGGSLATGGGGMLAGGAVLAGAVVIPASVMFGWKSHKKANELNKASKSLDDANKYNSELLAKSSDLTGRLSLAEVELRHHTEDFEQTAIEVRHLLLPLGWFSHLLRLVRAKMWGTYYLADEIQYVNKLSSSALRYTSKVGELRERFSQQ
jgi:hypothetical protein